MTIENLKAAVRNPQVRVTFKDKNGRINHLISIQDKFRVATLIVNTSMYWSDSYMDHHYIMEIIDGSFKTEAVTLDQPYY